MSPNSGSTSVLAMPRISFNTAPSTSHASTPSIPPPSSVIPSSATQPAVDTSPADAASCFSGAWLTPPHATASSPPSQLPSQTPGFYNAGNTCFLNAALQCILHQPHVTSLLLTDNRHRNAVTPPLRFCAYCCLQNLAHAVHAPQSPRALSAMPFARYTRSISPTFRPNRQEDAHEFVRGLLDAMVRAEVFGCAAVDPARWHLEARSDVHRLFGGALQSAVVCSECRHASVTSEPFLDLSLEVAGAHSIDNALCNFTSAETLKGDNRYRCDSCKKLVVASKRLSIRRAPNILTLHLKRFNRSQKDSRFVEFPDILNLGKYMLGKPQSARANYRLTAVLVHLGASRASGHYVAYVRTANGLWALKDDSTSRSVPLSSVLRQRAYVLFYSRLTDADLTTRTARKGSPGPASPTLDTPVRSSPIKSTYGKASPTKPTSSRSSPHKDLPAKALLPPAARGLRSAPAARMPSTPPRSPVTRRTLEVSERSAARRAVSLSTSLSPSGKPVSSRSTPKLASVNQTNDAEMLELSSESEEEVRSPSVKRSRVNNESHMENTFDRPSTCSQSTDSRTASAILRGAPVLPGTDDRVDDLPPIPRKPKEDGWNKSPAKNLKLGNTAESAPSVHCESAIKASDLGPDSKPFPVSSVPSETVATPTSTSSGKPETNSTVPTHRRNVLIGGSGSARKAMYRVFGVTHEGTKSDRKRPFLDSLSEVAGQTASETVASVVPDNGKQDPQDRVLTKKMKLASKNEVSGQIEGIGTVKKDLPSSKDVTYVGSSDTFGAEGVDCWNSSQPSNAIHRSGTDDGQRQKIAKRRRAGDDLDSDYDRGRQRKVKARSSSESSRNMFDSIHERRHGACRSPR